jgi:hypothetical protein
MGKFLLIGKNVTRCLYRLMNLANASEFRLAVRRNPAAEEVREEALSGFAKGRENKAKDEMAQAGAPDWVRPAR